ncbi:MAG TPA: phospholipid carrier-dependent glycosyltransferase [Actinomycetota bacterium]|nr:phospholipid carrier-dependent glycosyltransferase [Actinomycetota bacterium]
MFSAAIRLIRLAEPPEVVFDETYYAKDACSYLDYKPETCGLASDSEQSYVHPPLGKWIIAAGIKAFGYNSFGWRISAVVFGVGLVLVVYLLAGRLFKSQWVALVAGLLVSTDFLLFVQSRIAMLDIFLAFFIALGFLFLAIDREAAAAVASHTDEPGVRPLPVRRPHHRLAAGVAFGLALSVKWSAVYPLAAGALFALAWSVDLLRRRHLADPGAAARWWPPVFREVLFTGVAFGLVPLVVYLASYSAWFANELSKDCPYTVPARSEERMFSAGFYGLVEGECVRGLPGGLLNFADLHDRVADYHLHLTATHPYQSKAWTWPLVLRPVAYFYEGEEGRSNEIIGMANVFTWGAGLGALVWLALRSRRSWRPERVVLVGWAVQYVPWLLVTRPLFFFYMTPAVPFLLIGLAAALDALRGRSPASRRAVGAFLVLGVGLMLVLFFPILTAIEIDYDLWRRLMWIPHFRCGGLTCGWI